MIDEVKSRIYTRLTGEAYTEAVVDEVAQCVLDRLALRLGLADSDSLPTALYSVAVDASVKAYRRRYYEGIASESEGGLSTAFVDDILAEYADDIAGYLAAADAGDLSGVGVVRFL